MLSPDARAALTLKVVGGPTTDEIARAFLSSEAAIAQRIARRAHRELPGFSDRRLGAGSDGTRVHAGAEIRTEFSLSTEVTRLDCTSERSGPDPVQVLELDDGRRVRARAVVVATGARYRRLEIPNLAQFEGRGVSYWASPVERCEPDSE